eukprot:GEMP01040771.1.p1 GENE.GEMP01040771.1~~GEMP01040771.1.p1  ORF type:complete len:113 (+),score=25.00 GEMP01040771.1:590-928(+)
MDLVFVSELEYDKLGLAGMSNVKTVIVTLGDRGSQIVSNGASHSAIHVPAPKVDDIQDLCGAGDAFIAGFLYSWQQNSESLEACCEWGHRVAQKNIQRLGACAQVIRAEELI